MQRKLTDLAAIATLNDADLLHIVDVSDTTSDPAGTSFKVTVGQLKATFRPTVVDLSEAVDGITASFSVPSEPQYIVVNGATYFKDAGFTYTPLTVTLDFVPDIGMSLRAII
jgi:hypothetical protein